ncbi:MAG: SIS domain-containing protein [Ignavibacterium sp.]|nr:SIS domain-containing protein [Ignavibacterium sp.]MDW8374697.1 SIS domain-containing protein [Ignavibacteriales bacterium]
MNYSKDFLKYCIEVINQLNIDQIEKLVNELNMIRLNEGRLFIIGSGGGAGHASHAVCDFRKLCGIEAYAPYDNISELTARVNDEGWEFSILNWLKTSKLKYNDGLLVFSVGGGNIEKNISKNISNALFYAKEVKAKIFGIVGKDGGDTLKLGDAVVLIPTVNQNKITPITEGFQALIWHLLVSHPKLQINSTKWESTLTI